MNEIRDIIMILSFVLFAQCLGQRGIWQDGDGSHEYYISPRNLSVTYHEGESFCDEINGELVLIKSKRIQKTIRKLVAQRSGKPFGFYIGLRDIYNNGTFQWNDGTALKYENWNQGQPNVVGVQTCVTMGSRQFDEQLRWHDYYCTDRGMGFVCQRKKCPKGWSRNENSKKGRTCIDDRGFKLDAASFVLGFIGPFVILAIVIIVFVLYYKRSKRIKTENAVTIKQEPIYDMVASDYHMENNKTT